MNGVVNINKPLGITSFGAVSRVRRIVKVKKVGHTGTLDPMADGVLPVCIGKATKIAQLLTDKDKAYRAVIELGVTTDTQDAQGAVITSCEPHITQEDFNAAIQKFTGKIMQLPPMYSAIKCGGQKLCDLARKGITVERTPREITVYSIAASDFDGKTAVLEVSCSKGTYIRTLCNDIGQRLGCGAIMKSLTRTKSGRFDLSGAVTLEEFEKSPEKYIVPLDEMFDYPKYFANENQSAQIKNGCALVCELSDGMYRVYSQQTGGFLSLSAAENGVLRLHTAMWET